MTTIDIPDDIFFISNMGSLSLFQWCGYKLCRYTLNLI